MGFTAIISMVIMLAFPAIAQEPEKTAVTEVVHTLFRGMERGDSAMVSSTFRKGIGLATIFRDRNNVPVFRREASAEDFLKAVECLIRRPGMKKYGTSTFRSMMILPRSGVIMHFTSTINSVIVVSMPFNSTREKMVGKYFS